MRKTTSARRAQKATVANVTTLVTAALDGPESLRHRDLWVVAVKSGRELPWTIAGALNGETLARLVFEPFRTAGALCAIIPPVDAGVRAVTKGIMHARARVSYLARPTQPVEVWDDGRPQP